MTIRKTVLGVTAALLCLGVSHAAMAAGFQLKEQSAALQGQAFAGASSKADDVSTIFFNPAGLTRLSGTQVNIESSIIAPSAQFTPSAVTANGVGAPSPTIADNHGGDAGVAKLVPAFYAATQLADPNWHVGISVNTPFGLATQYANGWVGRYYALESDLLTTNVAPTIAYKINNQFSIGANVQAQYIQAKLTQAVDFGVGDGISKLTGNDYGFGYGVGALWEPRQDTRIGLNYRSRIQHTLDGDLKVRTPAGALAVNVGAKADVTTPDVLSLGITHELNDQWSVSGELAWTNWSLFNHLTVIDDNGTTRQDIQEDWSDTVFVALGAEYKYNPLWTFRGGLAYDQGAVDTEHRTFRIPDSDRFWTSLGASYKITDNANLDLGYTHIFARGSDVNENAAAASSGTVAGSFDSNVDIATAGVSFKF